MTPAFADFVDDFSTILEAERAFPGLLHEVEFRVLIALVVDELLTRTLAENEWYPAIYFDSLSISAERLRQALHRGKIRAVKIDRQNHYCKADVLRLYKFERA